MTRKSNRGRLRFLGVEQKRGSGGERVLDVELEWQGRSYGGDATGTGTTEGDLRATAEATLAAVAAATERQLSFRLVGVKLVHAFDGQVIITSVLLRGDKGSTRLLGTYAASEGDLLAAAAIAVLNSLNRVIAPALEAAGAATPEPGLPQAR